MKLDASALKVHLSACSAYRGHGHRLGLGFTINGQPAIVSVPHR